MSRILKIQALARRAISLIGKTGRQAASVKQQRAGFYREVWREAAAVLESELESLDPDTFLIRRGHASTKVFLNYTALDDPVSLRVAGNKPVVHRLLQAQGIPVPAYREFCLNTVSTAIEFLSHHRTCVVKPASGTGGGQGVTTNVQTPRQLRNAAVSAGGHGSGLIIEEQIAGRNIRLLILDGELLDAIDRRPPSLTGDGRSSVSSLLDRLNTRRVQAGISVAQSIVTRDQDMRRTLASQGLTLRSVPRSNQIVQLKTVINDNSAADNDSIAHLIHDDVLTASLEAVRAVGLRLAGVDVVTTDPTKSMSESGGVVLEVNSTPGLFFHYAGPKIPSRVAVPILAACLDCSVDACRWQAGHRTPEESGSVVGTNFCS